MITTLVRAGVREQTACRILELARSTFQYRPKGHGKEEEALREELRSLARAHRRYGYRRIAALLRRLGRQVNPKRVYRLWKEEHLEIPRRRPRKRPLRGISFHPRRALRPDHVWTVDFAFDRTARGEVLKLLIVLDEYTRECLAIRVAGSIGAAELVDTLLGIVEVRGAPEYLRRDNGPEFIARELRAWLGSRKTHTAYIEPGHPWENGFAESFVGKLRDECLNQEVFLSRQEAVIVIEEWRREYNEVRPHSALGYRTPKEAALSPVGRAPEATTVRQGRIQKGQD